MRSRYITIIVAALLGGLLCLPAVSAAAPPDQTIQAGANSQVQQTTVTFDADQGSVTATGTLSYTVRLRPAATADSVSARFELLAKDGTSIYMRTKYWTFDLRGNKGSTVELAPQPDATGYYSYTFTRDVSDLNLSPGDYDVRCTVRTSTAQGTAKQELASHLIVYDLTAGTAPVALVIRVGAPVLCRTDGIFASDPATGTARLRAQQLDDLARAVITRPQLNLAIAPSPLLLEELAGIAGGCQYVDQTTGKTVALDASSDAARFVAQTLTDLQTAVATGRLEIAWQGYADPDVGALLEYQLSNDLPTQYKQGAAAVQNVLNVKPAAFTAPYGDISVSQARTVLAPLGVKQVLPASYNQVSQSLETDTLINALAQLYGQQGQSKATVIVVGLPAAPGASNALLDRVDALQACPWLTFQPLTTTALRNPSADPGASRQFYEAPQQNFLPIFEARQGALGLAGAAGSADQNAQKATQLSLIAENAFGPAPAAPRSAADATPPEDYAQATTRVVKKAFSVLKLKAHPVTLAGNSGEVPITVVNSSNTQMQVHLEFISARNNMKISPAKSPLLTAASNDTLFSPNVTLRSVSSSDLRVRLMSGNYLICEDSIAISGSYLDIIGIVAIVVIVGVGLVLYLWRHPKKAQKG